VGIAGANVSTKLLGTTTSQPPAIVTVASTVTFAAMDGHTWNDTLVPSTTVAPPNTTALLNAMLLPLKLVKGPAKVVVPLSTDKEPMIDNTGKMVAAPEGATVSNFPLGI